MSTPAELYKRHRFPESAYRSSILSLLSCPLLKKLCGKTGNQHSGTEGSRNPAMRFLFMALGLILVNVWVTLSSGPEVTKDSFLSASQARSLWTTFR
jgi:hypothetical protein